MPIYEFHCGNCDKDSEILVRSTDWKGTKCPQCGSTKLTKKLSVFASTVANGSSGADAPSCTGSPSTCACGRGGPHRH